jgi:alpha-ketoglutarate-dependent taurine dioxygenase
MKKFLFRANSLNELAEAAQDYQVLIYNSTPDIEGIEEVANLLGGAFDNPTFGKIRELKVNNQTLNSSVGSSNNAHPPHTDGVYSSTLIPSVMLQCVQPDTKGGGKGLFWNLTELFDHIPTKYRDFFSENIFCYSRLREDGATYDKYEGPIFFEHHGNPSFRWRYDLQVRPRLHGEVSKEKNKIFHDSVTWMLTFLLENPPEIYIYQQGDIVVCDNIHTVHGRTKILSPERFFRRVWLT